MVEKQDWLNALFQFTPLREGRRTPITRNFAPSYFNSRPSARGDDKCRKRRFAASNFNSRPSARGDIMRLVKQGKSVFQFTPLREGRRAAGYSAAPSSKRFQFTPLREGRPGL